LVKKIITAIKDEYRLAAPSLRLLISEPELTFSAEVKKFIKHEYKAANKVLEFGSGGSTLYAARLGGKDVVSVETDRLWAFCLRARLSLTHPKERIKIRHGEIGFTKEWGRPRNLGATAKYKNYCTLPWRKFPEFDPDLILIDGRFRVATFLTAITRMKTKTRILFDDYGDRKWFHAVERFVEPPQMVGRMAMFEVEPMPMSADLEKALDRYYNVPN